MAGTSLIALIDDITSILDDVSLMAKTATHKTAGVLGDDLALNAQQVTGVHPDRELPVVWAVAKGSLRNKAILVPAALAISALAPWAITPLLMAGGLFLCYEGFEKLAHRFLHRKAEDEDGRAAMRAALAAPPVDLVTAEKNKVKGAIRTDFILSAEIIVITLGTVAAAPFWQQLAVLAGIAVLMTAFVYGLVAGIVRLDDAGLYLSASERAWRRKIGHAILSTAPYMMKTLSVAGTIAMFLVGGGILLHGVHPANDWVEQAALRLDRLTSIGFTLRWMAPLTLGIVAGALVLGLVELAKRLRQTGAGQS